MSAADGQPGSAELLRRCEAAERELRLLRALLDLLPDFVYVHDYDLRFQYANQGAANYFGRSKEQVVGRLLREVEPDADQAKFYEDVCRAIMREGKPRLTDNLPLKLRDGTVRYLRQHDYPFKDPTTGQPMLFGLSRDVTAERDLLAERVRRERLEREMEIAKQIQRSILPRERPRVSGFDVAGETVPSHYAAGDFFDWWTPTDTGELLLCLGDVTGHGIGPALLAAECRAYARALLRGAASLDGDAGRLSRAIGDDLTEGRFVTFAAVGVNPAAGSVALLSAGHGPVLFYRHASKQAEELPSQGMPLGLGDVGDYDAPVSLAMSSGDVLLILSDGIHEAVAASGEQLGVNRVKRIVANGEWSDASSLAHLLIRAARDFAGGDGPHDDLTAVVVMRT